MPPLTRPIRLCDPADLATLGVDAIIDVRSPAEFAEDHVPGAINLPVLDDVERAQVGTIYVQQSRFTARRLGGALVARNAARHLEGPLAQHPQRWHPLVYCWRGGQRSGSFATILAQVGWRVAVLEGGYRSWRRLVVRALYDGPLGWRLILLDGNTGTAKTEVLLRAAQHGAQIIDLEGMARHRGSVFGAEPSGQPAQKGFESAIMAALAALDPAHPVLVEAESPRLGMLTLPPALWAAMRTAPRIEIAAPLHARAEYLARSYAAAAADRTALVDTITRLRPFQPAERIVHWQGLAVAGRDADLAAGLMEDHYDPLYARARRRQAGPIARLEVPDLYPDRLDALAQRIAATAAAAG